MFLVKYMALAGAQCDFDNAIFLCYCSFAYVTVGKNIVTIENKKIIIS